ncbi:MAG TPA: class I SAM-dependent methyltransferase [Gammaproteobacteria bacterium]
MDAKVEAVKKAYQARADEESGKLPSRAGGGPQRDIDELLLPIGPATASFVNLLIKEAEARAILEVGTSYGYSTVWLAEAARETGGRVTGLEIHPRKVDYARAELEKAGLAEHVEFRVGDALETLKTLPGPFDFVLIDLWKDLYTATFDAVYPKLADGALIVADNMLYPESARANADAYRRRVRAAKDMSSVMLPIGSGIEVSRYR